MQTAGCWEPYESRGSRTVLSESGWEAFTPLTLQLRWFQCERYPISRCFAGAKETMKYRRINKLLGGYKGFALCADDAGAGTARRFWLGCRERLRLSLCHLPTRPLWASRHIRAPGDAADRAHQADATAARRRRHPYSACTPRGLGDRPGGIRCAHSTTRAVRSAPTCGFQKFHPAGFARPGRIRSRPRTRVPGMALSAGGLLRSHREHSRAHGLARLQVSMRLRGVFQRIGLFDLDLDCAREHHAEEILCHRREIGTGGGVGV